MQALCVYVGYKTIGGQETQATFTKVRRFCALVPTAAAATVFFGCSSFDISEPKDGAIVRSPSNTTVTVQASPSMSGLVVKIDGTDVSNQITYVSDSQSQGNLSLPAGNHSITAEADVPCWYCTPQTYHPTVTHIFCVAANSLSTYTKIAFADDSNHRSWIKTSDTTIGVATDDGTLMTRWNLIRLGGIASSTGLIESAENSCLCMRSTDDYQDTPIGLAICDPSDATQQWEALPVAPGVYLFQNLGRGISSACLTEGPNNILIQRANHDTSDQHWSFKDNTTGQVGGSPF